MRTRWGNESRSVSSASLRRHPSDGRRRHVDAGRAEASSADRLSAPHPFLPMRLRFASLLAVATIVGAARSRRRPAADRFGVHRAHPRAHAHGSVWKFTTELVDHLPASATVPDAAQGAGLRARAPSAGCRTSRSSTGTSARWRRGVAAREGVLARHERRGPRDDRRRRSPTRRRSRGSTTTARWRRGSPIRAALAPAERARLMKEAKPIYWLTGRIHSPETGSPEMLMELAYRLAVDESEFVQRHPRRTSSRSSRRSTEVDGRDRDGRRRQAVARRSGSARGGVPLIYWGKYTAHDNNRDGMVLSQKLTQNVMDGFLHWQPTVDARPARVGAVPLHEHRHRPVQRRVRSDRDRRVAHARLPGDHRADASAGLPGVWTHGFYDGWAPNYMLADRQSPQLHRPLLRDVHVDAAPTARSCNLPAAQTTSRRGIARTRR